jgi:hypothetical protein
VALDSTLLKRTGFDLDTAVFLAEASAKAYNFGEEAKSWALARGFRQAAAFDLENVQGYWCAGDDVALLVFRGTSNPGQWLRDVRFLPVTHPWGEVHVGFLRGVEAVERALRDFDAVASTVNHVWVAGHSLGGALALIAAARFKINKICTPLIHTYGQPAVGLNDFAERFSIELPQRLWRFVNQNDVVPRVPPIPYQHTGTVKRIARPGVLEFIAAGAATLESVPLTSAGINQGKVAREIIGGGAALESASAASSAGVQHPVFTDKDPPPLTALELSRLQVGLGAAASPELKGPALEGALPWFSDHAIAEYVRLLEDIRTRT